MFVVSLAGWRRRFGPLLRTFVIAMAVLWALFVAYRVFTPRVPASGRAASQATVKSRCGAGKIAVHAERFVRTTAV